MNRLHLISNAHLDPMWLWEWEEGAATALGTFRAAADLCEEFDDFVFNHNESVLYEWVEEFEPTLFKRIRALVKKGKWHIMGGWYVQPDCNMPSGESFVRQGLVGKRYFKAKFGAEPTTAINFDPFGHTRGLVQILKKLGYDSYVHMRPGPDDLALPGDDYLWVGYDGSEIMGHRTARYGTMLGHADEMAKAWLEKNKGKPVGAVFWGVGNHGGGPSRQDIRNFAKLNKEVEDYEIVHSTCEAYFAELDRESLPRHERDVNPWGVGCYTSQVRIKQKHRLLENEFYMTEKMASCAALQGLMKYPKEELDEALRDLLFCEFHDILPGSGIQPVEDAGLRQLDHGLYVVSRAKTRAFFALTAGQKQAKEDQYPILIYNPHPFPVSGVFECEVHLPVIRFTDEFSNPVVYQNGKRLPCQPEKEYHNINLDWRNRAVFAAELKPGVMNRFDCIPENLPERPKPELKEENGCFTVNTEEIEVIVNAKTGLVDRYRVNGVDFVESGAFRPLVIKDNADPWGMSVHRFREIEGVFELMEPLDGTQFSGVTERILPSVRVIEDGEVRTVIEAVFAYGRSTICQHYKIPKRGAELEVDVRVFWNEKDRMLKLSVPTPFNEAAYRGQVAYGADYLPNNGDEAVAQKWVAVVAEDAGQALTCINDGLYGSDCAAGELRLSLLRSPAYSAHPMPPRPLLRDDRFLPRIDQGERQYRFWFNGGPAWERLDRVDREALAHNEKPYIVHMFPSGQGKTPKPLVTLSGDVVQLAALKKAETGNAYIVRLFEPTGAPRATTLRFPALGFSKKVKLGAFEIKSFRLDPKAKSLKEVDLMER